MDNLPTLMREIRSKYADDVPLEVLEAYCRRYLHITIVMLSSSQQGSMALGAGQRQEGGSFGKRLMLVVGNLSSSHSFLSNSLFGITTLLFLDSHCFSF